MCRRQKDTNSQTQVVAEVEKGSCLVMNRVWKLIRTFGWLPGAQACVFLFSTAGFAVLARTLGPEYYARFAVVILVFTVSSALTDLSAQSYALIQRPSPQVTRLAWLTTLISSGASCLLILGFAPITGAWMPGGPLTIPEVALLCISLVCQFATQVPRARLVASSRYASMAVSDVSATLLGILSGILIANSSMPGFALLGQLAISTACRMVFAFLGTHRLTPLAHIGGPLSLSGAIRYGLGIIPLNLASYLGRSIDSGVLPALVPAAAAAGYSRSYQVIIIPITQLQIAVGAPILDLLSKSTQVLHKRSYIAERKLWKWMSLLTLISGIGISAFSVVIENILFGPKWPMVHVMIVAMVSTLPGIAMAAFGSWSLQLVPNKGRTVAHFGAVVAVPIAVVIAATSGSFQVALTCLVIMGGLVQPLLLSLIHHGALSANPAKLRLGLVFQWLLFAFFYLISASYSGFWIWIFH